MRDALLLIGFGAALVALTVGAMELFFWLGRMVGVVT